MLQSNALSVDVLPASNHETVIGIVGPGSVKPLGSHAINMHEKVDELTWLPARRN